MSEHIVHTGVLEDSFAICYGLTEVKEEFKEIMKQYERFAWLGCITVAGDTFSTRLLNEYKQKWNICDEAMKARMAFVLGWISHRACDRTMKPIWVEPPMKIASDVDPTLSPSECSVYHEGFLYNKYYKDVPKFRFGIFDEELKELPGMDEIDAERARMFIQQSFGTNYMAIQTLEDIEDDQKWFENICTRAQKFYVDLNRYKRSAGCPKPEFTEEFLTAINWYDESDAIIRLANALRWGQETAQFDFDAVLEETPKSYYGRALKLSIGYITAASEFFSREDMSLDELKDRLDIGKLGPGGQGV